MEVATNNNQKVLEKYQKIRRQSMAICQPLALEDYVIQPTDDVSPPKWHLGHTTWFFENFVLVPFAKDYQPFDLKLNWFFNSYYESQGPRIIRSMRGNMSRPSVQKVFDYHSYVDEHLEQFIQDSDLQKNDLLQLLEVGLQHEQQHQELLLMDIKYILGTNPIFPEYNSHSNKGENTAEPTNANTPINFLEISEGLYPIGHRGDDFCWDNEQSEHKVYLESFSIADRLTTNGEYLEFIIAEAYENHEYWLSEGWEWAKNLEVKAPLYWHKNEDQWFIYNLEDGLQPIDLDAPVSHVSFFEADAFAAWKGMRLATEFEWETACKILQPTIPESANFLETGQFGTTAKTNAKDFQFYGNSWEWTASSYLPYPRYPRFKGALGEYNGKFMINQMVLRGGSFATPLSHIRSTYRNFFPTAQRWQFTGIRLVK